MKIPEVLLFSGTETQTKGNYKIYRLGRSVSEKLTKVSVKEGWENGKRERTGDFTVLKLIQQAIRREAGGRSFGNMKQMGLMRVQLG